MPVRTAPAFIIDFSGSNLESMIIASVCSVLFTNISARCTHLAALKRTTAAFILLFGISHPRFYGLSAWAVFYVPDLFGVCHLLLVLWAYNYLCRFISTIPRVTQISPSLCFGCFFSCVLFYSLREMCCYFMAFGLLLLLLVRSIWGGSSQLYPILCLWRGPWIGLVGGSPFPPLFLFSSFGLELSHGVYVRCLRGNLFPIISLLGTV